LKFNFDQPFWRGYGDAEWPLRPQVFRRDPLHPEVPKYDECALIGHFQVRAATRSHTKAPELDDFFGWLFLAQHYGLPTRLFDWTENPLVALYFAVEEQEHKDRDRCVWALWPGKLNQDYYNNYGPVQIGNPNDSYDLVQIREPTVIELAKAAFTGAKCHAAILAIDGREIGPTDARADG